MLNLVFAFRQKPIFCSWYTIRSLHRPTSRGKQAFEVFVRNKITLFVDDSDCDQIVVLVNLVHQSSKNI
jgi:hypothetical protein